MKLYYPLGHRLAGHEEPFPEPDNLLKLARSNQNAATIGTFLPVCPMIVISVDRGELQGCSLRPVALPMLVLSTVTVVVSTIAEPLSLKWKKSPRTSDSCSAIAICAVSNRTNLAVTFTDLDAAPICPGTFADAMLHHVASAFFLYRPMRSLVFVS